MICPQCQSQNADNARFCEACGRRLEKPAIPSPSVDPVEPGAVGLAVGAMIGDRFRIVAELARGDMGPVYEAVDTLSDKEVVVRLMRPDRLAGANAVKNAIRDALLARDIRHPNVAAIYDAGDIGGMVYVVEELIRGDTMSNGVLKEARMPLAQAAGVMRQLLAGVEAGHAKGLIHRNLKPSNVRTVDGRGGGKTPSMVIEDFGLWRASGVTQTGITGSKPMPYMAPELITAPDIAQPSADIYSLSVMFYQLLSDLLPSGGWTAPSEGRDDTPEAVDELIKKGLSNNPKLRPQSASAFLSEMETAIAQPVARLKVAEPPPQEPTPPPAPEPVAPVELKAGMSLTPPQPTPAPPTPPLPPPAPEPSPAPTPAPKPAKPFFGLPMPAVYAGAGVLVTAIGAFAFVSLTGGPKPVSPSPGAPTIGGLPDPYASTTVTPPPQYSPPPPPPPPQPRQPGYEDLSGYWLDDAGNRLSVTVNSFGAVTGQVTQGPLTSLGFAGQFTGGNFQFQLGNAVGVVAASTGQMTDECHIKYQTFDGYTGLPNGYAMLHINHLPGEDCP